MRTITMQDKENKMTYTYIVVEEDAVEYKLIQFNNMNFTEKDIINVLKNLNTHEIIKDENKSNLILEEREIFLSRNGVLTKHKRFFKVVPLSKEGAAK